MNATTKNAIIRKGDLDIRPTLKQVVEKIRPFIRFGVVLGMAQDGLPVLLNTQDKKAPNFIVWDKVKHQSLCILKVASEYIFAHQTDGIEFVVLTTNVEEYGLLNEYGMGTNSKTPCIGIIPFFSNLSDVVICGLSRWIYEGHTSTKKPVILMIDGLENVNKSSPEFQDHFRRILSLGREKHVFVIGTSSKKKFAEVHDWLDGFQKELYGRDIPWEFEYHDAQDDVVIFYTPMTEMI